MTYVSETLVGNIYEGHQKPDFPKNHKKIISLRVKDLDSKSTLNSPKSKIFFQSFKYLIFKSKDYNNN